MEINDILKMLDWNNDVEVQREGRKYAANVNCLKIFLQPMDRQFNKNIWENCAMILSEKEDELLTPYLIELLDWLQDMNWPGAYNVLERLQNYQDYEKLSIALGNRIVVANALENQIWLSNLAELFVCDKMKTDLNENIWGIIQTYIE